MIHFAYEGPCRGCTSHVQQGRELGEDTFAEMCPSFHFSGNGRILSKPSSSSAPDRCLAASSANGSGTTPRGITGSSFYLPLNFTEGIADRTYSVHPAGLIPSADPHSSPSYGYDLGLGTALAHVRLLPRNCRAITFNRQSQIGLETWYLSARCVSSESSFGFLT